MESGDLVYHRLLGTWVVIETFMSQAMVQFQKHWLKNVKINLLDTSYQEIKKSGGYKHSSEQYMDEVQSLDTDNDR